MKHASTVIIGIIIVLVLGLWMVTFQVSFHEVAVVTTFGKATEADVIRGDTEQAQGFIGNLRFKWPAPIQREYKYDTRVRVIDSRLEDLQTLDKQRVVVSVSIAWRVRDPLRFFSLRTEENATDQIRARVRGVNSVIGEYRFDELTNTNPSKLKITEAADKMKTRLQSDMNDQQYGIEVVEVAFKRIVLPAQVTTKVFERMRADRERLASVATAEGEAAATTLRSEAAEQAKQILSFAQRRADELRAEGEGAALAYVEVFKDHEDFAIFLRRLETYRQALKNNTTFLFDWKFIPEMRGGPIVPGTPAGK